MKDQMTVRLSSGGEITLTLEGVIITRMDESDRRHLLEMVDKMRRYARLHEVVEGEPERALNLDVEAVEPIGVSPTEPVEANHPARKPKTRRGYCGACGEPARNAKHRRDGACPRLNGARSPQPTELSQVRCGP